jgi:anti-sigma regulatory factor (Ser/Thr protein kinase)
MDASILLSLVNQNLRYLYDTNRTDRFLTQISREYLQIADEDQFPTMLVALVDLNSREMFYSNANGELPVLLRNGNAVTLEKAEGMHVGFFDDPVYERKVFEFEPGDRLFFYSDALAEIRDHHGDLLGRRGVRRVFEDNMAQSTENFLRIVDNVENLNGGLPLDDDTTLVQVDFLSPVNREYEFCNMAEWKSIQNELIAQIIRLDYPRETAEQMSIALDEMCINAFVHGNHRDHHKYVLIRVEMNCRCLEFTITDQGEGFDRSCVDDPVECLDEILARDVEEEYTHGRGIWITEKLVDLMEYRHGGNCVYLRKNKVPGATLFAKKKFRALHSRK